MIPTRLYGFFSQKALTVGGARTLIYQAVDGREVEINFVSPDPQNSGTRWDDVVSVGEVTEKLRPGRAGTFTTKMWGVRPAR